MILYLPTPMIKKYFIFLFFPLDDQGKAEGVAWTAEWDGCTSCLYTTDGSVCRTWVLDEDGVTWFCTDAFQDVGVGAGSGIGGGIGGVGGGGGRKAMMMVASSRHDDDAMAAAAAAASGAPASASSAAAAPPPPTSTGATIGAGAGGVNAAPEMFD